MLKVYNLRVRRVRKSAVLLFTERPKECIPSGGCRLANRVLGGPVTFKSCTLRVSTAIQLVLGRNFFGGKPYSVDVIVQGEQIFEKVHF